MILSPVPEEVSREVVIGLVVRKPLDIVKACFQCLWNQVLPERVTVRYHVILDTDDPLVIEYLTEMFEGRDDIVEQEAVIQQDFSDTGPTHHWQPSSMARVGALKTRILKRALQSRAEAVWLVDADLLCDPRTLKSLWYTEAPVAFGVFWTRWHDSPEIHSAPQVWLRHPYQLDGRGYDEAGFRRRLRSRKLTQVWGGGACTLIRRNVLEMGVTFDYVPGVSQEGMMAGEDRHFNIQCESRHIPMIADPWPHIAHLYHVSDKPRTAEWMQQLQEVHTEKHPAWLNLNLKMLEPVPMGPNQFGIVPHHIVRVRVGSGAILPDLEIQALQHLDGQPFIAKVHYPKDYKVHWLQGQRRLMEVTVIDSKTDLPMPILGDELAGAFDLTTYSLAQQESMQ